MLDRPLTPLRFYPFALYANRSIRKWSQADLAFRVRGLGVRCAKSTVGAWEHGTMPTADAFLAMSELFGGYKHLVSWTRGSVCVASFEEASVLRWEDCFYVVGPWLSMPEPISQDIAEQFAVVPYQLDSYCSQIASWVRSKSDPDKG